VRRWKRVSARLRFRGEYLRLQGNNFPIFFHFRRTIVQYIGAVTGGRIADNGAAVKKTWHFYGYRVTKHSSTISRLSDLSFSFNISDCCGSRPVPNLF
jgi:hypothetical protein